MAKSAKQAQLEITSLLMKPCYQCNKIAHLSTRSRCVDCECDRSMRNESENDVLRARIEILEANAPRPRTGKVPSFADRARTWCAEHQVRSVPHTVVRSWRDEPCQG